VTVAPTEAELADFRAEAASMWIDTFTAYRPGAPTKDADGYDVPGFASQGSTPGKVRSRSGRALSSETRMVNIGGSDRPVLEGGLHIPVDAFVDGSNKVLIAAGDRGVGWEFVCTAIGAGSSGSVGARFLVVGTGLETFQTARRLDVVQV
jgi:hypothetical protein